MKKTQTYFEKNLCRLSKIQIVLKKTKKSRLVEAITNLSGLWADRKDLPTTDKYVRNLRNTSVVLHK